MMLRGWAGGKDLPSGLIRGYAERTDPLALRDTTGEESGAGTDGSVRMCTETGMPFQ